MSEKQAVMSHDLPAGLGGETGKHSSSQLAEADDAAPRGNRATVTSASGAADASIALESGLTIAEAAELKARILHNVRTMTPLRFDATEVESVDTAGLQLLAVAFKAASEKGLEVGITGMSVAFANGASLIGLSSLFGIYNDDQVA